MPEQTENEPTLRAYRFALDPTREQADQLARSAGNARWAFNWGLHLKVTAHQEWRDRIAELIDQGHSEADAKKQLKQQTAEHKKHVKALEAHKKDLKAAARAEKDPQAKARLTEQVRHVQKQINDAASEGFRTGLALPNAFDMSGQWRLIRDLPKEEGGCPWWDEVSSYVFSTGFANADRAFKNFTDSYTGKRAGRAVGYPRFKKKGRARDSFSIFHDVKKPSIRAESSACNWPQYKGKKGRVATGRYRGLVVPSLGTVRTHDSTKRLARAVRQGRAQVQSVTISRSGNRWYASVLTKVQQTNPEKPTRRQRENGAVAVKWSPQEITLYCNGQFETIQQPRYLRQNADKLANAQRALSRTDKASARRGKARCRVAELHHRIAEQRAGWLHQLTARLTKTYEQVALEDLGVQEMVKREQPREKTRRRNQAILDSAPGETRRQITYKTSWYGSSLALTERGFPTTQTCSNCGRRNSSPTPPGARFHCDNCGHSMPRSHNSAAVIARHATVPAPERDAAQDNGEAQNARGAAVRPPSGVAGGRESGSPAEPGPRSSP